MAVSELNKDLQAQVQGEYDQAMQATPETEYKNLTQDAIYQPYYQDAIGQAIQNRSREKYDLGLSKQLAGAKRQAQVNAGNRTAQASELVRQENKLNDQIKEQKRQAERERKAARAGVLSNILGIGGAVGGAMAGGPAGAMAGYQIGSGVGGAIGGQ